MKKYESIYREILYKAIEKKEFSLTQSELSKKLALSLSLVNLAIKKLERIGSIKINQRNFKILDAKKILYYWSSIRNLERDILFKIRIELPIREIERIMPNVLFTAYSAYKLKYDDVPADYSEVYVYAEQEEINLIKKRILKLKTSEKNPNLIILKKDRLLKLYSSIPVSQLFVDLWNLKQWYAKEFINSLEEKLKI